MIRNFKTFSFLNSNRIFEVYIPENEGKALRAFLKLNFEIHPNHQSRKKCKNKIRSFFEFNFDPNANHFQPRVYKDETLTLTHSRFIQLSRNTIKTVSPNSNLFDRQWLPPIKTSSTSQSSLNKPNATKVRFHFLHSSFPFDFPFCLFLIIVSFRNG